MIFSSSPCSRFTHFNSGHRTLLDFWNIYIFFLTRNRTFARNISPHGRKLCPSNLNRPSIVTDDFRITQL